VASLVKRGDPIAWHDAPDGGARGVITERVSEPYIIDVAPSGQFDIFTLDSHDKPRHVTAGRGRNVTLAKSKATSLALANIKELKEERQAQIIDANVTRLEPEAQPAWVKTLKVFIGLALLVAATILFARWLLIYRPHLALRIFAWVFGCLFAAYRILKFFEHLDKIRERLAKRWLQTAQASAKKGRR
jgi:hypothetical protein